MWFDDAKGRGRSLFSAGNRKRRRSVLAVDARTRDRQQVQLRRGLLAAGGLVLVGAALALLGYAVRRSGDVLFYANPTYTIRHLDIRSDGPLVTAEKFSDWTGIRPEQNLFAVDINRVRDTFLQRVPAAKGLAIRRLLPDTLEVRITERIPLARLGSSAYLGADHAGVAFGIRPSQANLPCLLGLRATPTVGMRLTGRAFNALEVLDVCDRTRLGQLVHIAAIDIRQPEYLLLQLTDGEQVRLTWQNMERSTPEARLNLELKLRDLVRVQQSAAAQGRRLQAVDLTFNHEYIPAEPAQE